MAAHAPRLAQFLRFSGDRLNYFGRQSERRNPAMTTSSLTSLVQWTRSGEQRRLVQACALGFMLVGLYRLFSNWPGIWDIRLSDEGIYLTNALGDVQTLMRDPEFSPLYCLFYRFVAAAIGSESGAQLYLAGG